MIGWPGAWNERSRLALALIGGALLAAAFPKWNVAGLAWVAPGIILLAALGSESPFRVGYVAGLAFHLVALHWLLFIPVSFYPILGWLGLSGFLALYPAAWCWMCAKADGGDPESEGRRKGTAECGTWLQRQVWALFCATAWVALEMAQARVLTGFPWNLLGVSQYRMLPLIQVASWTGVYGVSFLVAWVSVSLLLTWRALLREPANRRVWAGNLLLPVLAVTGAYAAGMAKVARPTQPARHLRVALVQPSIPQTMIWDSAASAARFDELLKLSGLALATRPELLIWPEAAVPSLPRWDTNLWQAITNHLAAGRAWLVLGADDAAPRGPDDADYFNSAFLVSPRGELAASYRKRRLVMFGEYVPLARWLPFLKWITPIGGDFKSGDGVVPFTLPDLGARTSVLICFEDVFPHSAREHAAADVDFLVNLTNDGWFGRSAAQWQHAANALFRAVENGLPLVRCANNGLTCWIADTGALHEVFFGDSKDIYSPGVKTALVPLPSAGQRRTTTFYNRHGDVFGWGCGAVCALVVATQRARAWRRHARQAG